MEKAKILIVDDTPDNLSIMSEVLKVYYHVKVANGGEKAIEIAAGKTPPDLILLDSMLPEMNGYEVCRRLKKNKLTKNIPVIFLTAKAEEANEGRGLELGAVDYITKPINISRLITRVKNHLKLKLASDFLRNQNNYLENEVQKRTEEVNANQDVTIHALTSLAEIRDNETGNHTRRTQSYVKLLANKLKNNLKFVDVLTDSYINMIFKLVPLHDIGKVGIPEAILLKPEKLTQEEFEIMKTHTAIGKAAIENAEKQLGKRVGFLKHAKEIVYYHHEKWNGSGYPIGLTGEEIPLSARILAIADVYDALISKRVYKQAIPHERVVEIIVGGRSSHFDPDMVDAFFEINTEFKAIAEEFVDTSN